MSNWKSSLIITAATIGSGVFALPYVVAQAGWLLTLGYFIALGAVVVTTHMVYLKTLAAEGEKERLLGLARKYFGASGFWFGFVGIVVGLLLSFVIFLILGTQFIQLLFPTLPYSTALFIFWLLLAIPALVGNRRAVSLELASIVSVAAIIIFIFASSNPTSAFASISTISLQNLFLPFGIVLFMLAGWTGVEPFYESVKSKKRHSDVVPAPCSAEALRKGEEAGVHASQKVGSIAMLALGTLFAIALYWMFASGILSSTPRIAADTVSGLAGWPIWKKDLVAIFGLFAVWTVAMPISHEIRNALEKDLRWNPIVARLIIIGLPLATVLLGFNNFLAVVGLTGGLFIGMQYLLIIAVGRRALTLSSPQKFWLDIIAIVFLIAALSEIIHLIP
jgi:hypothetical protein